MSDHVIRTVSITVDEWPGDTAVVSVGVAPALAAGDPMEGPALGMLAEFMDGLVRLREAGSIQGIRLVVPDSVAAVAQDAPAPLPRRTVWDLVRAERAHQVSLGFTATHDQEHTLGELVDAAVAHLAAAQDDDVQASLQWPWRREDAPVSGNRRRHLIVALALLVAEMERLSPGLAETCREEVRP